MFEKKALKRIQPQLRELKKEMMTIAAMSNKVEAIIRLFQVISPLQDTGCFAETINKLMGKNKYFYQLEALLVIQKHIMKAGRCLCGMNRTKPGEKVTADNVFLGNINGIWTKPASYWLARQEEKDGVWDSISYQAESFIENHVYDIIKQIKILQG